MKRCLYSLLFFFPTWVAVAAEKSSDFFTDSTNGQDTSVSVLGQIFGSIGHLLQGSSGEMLGRLFYKFNEGITIIAAFWLGFVFVMIVFRSAQEGSFLGANKQVPMLCLRIALACACIVPIPVSDTDKKCDICATPVVSGYSVAQIALMQVVIWGVNFANSVWNYALDRLQEGEMLWHPPTGAQKGVSSQINEKLLTGILGSEQATEVSGLGKITFANIVYSYMQQAKAKKGDIGQLPYTVDNASYTVQFPGHGDTQCGSLSWDIKQVCSSPRFTADEDSQSTTACRLSKVAVESFIQHLIPAAQRYVCKRINTFCAGVDLKDLTAGGRIFFSAFLDYVEKIIPIFNVMDSNYKPSAQFIKRAKEKGWVSAGSYYYDISRVGTQIHDQQQLVNYIPSQISNDRNPFIKFIK